MPSNAKKILIAEDEKPMARALEFKLKHEGLDVDVVSNGEEVMTMLKKGHYALLLLDLIMPSMNGFEVLEELKKTGSKVKVIVLSNLSQEDDARKARDLGALDYFVKSNTPLAEIIKRVKEVL